MEISQEHGRARVDPGFRSFLKAWEREAERREGEIEGKVEGKIERKHQWLQMVLRHQFGSAVDSVLSDLDRIHHDVHLDRLLQQTLANSGMDEIRLTIQEMVGKEKTPTGSVA